ncbi:secondary thiamine-phosphate synthase enzyme YjbQ [Serpentinicella alkaliphila]|uniref:Secondary thiamine-phosphate synthase enzyme n=1 Tax=Serpentinicella alkaliphila TaxID=1734049 RepID=A0A4R2T998_9FIRM|nr:secondary thiamine-phosphate synthase enzyme YjbQ [Serpentinicella alkaliphila]QUH25501.1 YjbQ family protein [Serpentinicella alkaliphila]TCP99687.1 secondary thiamine-phosphate synthase enzyme [Serpentinicella alkaliphila]
MLKELQIQTNRLNEFIDITDKVQKLVTEGGIMEGTVTVFIPHTTAGITVNENTDHDVQKDMIKQLNDTIPYENNYAHIEGNSAAHIKASIMGFSVTIIINRGSLLLGTWQGLYFCEFDGPRKRRVFVKVMNG